MADGCLFPLAARRWYNNYEYNEGNVMSKYTALWEYLQKDGNSSLRLTCEEIGRIAGTPIDHSFLKYKKESAEYGYLVEKISMKERTVAFTKIERQP